MHALISALVLSASLLVWGSTRVVAEAANLQPRAAFADEAMPPPSANGVSRCRGTSTQEEDAVWPQAELAAHAPKTSPIGYCCQGACQGTTDIDPSMAELGQHSDGSLDTAQVMRSSSLAFRYAELSYQLDRPPKN